MSYATLTSASTACNVRFPSGASARKKVKLKPGEVRMSSVVHNAGAVSSERVIRPLESVSTLVTGSKTAVDAVAGGFTSQSVDWLNAISGSHEASERKHTVIARAKFPAAARRAHARYQSKSRKESSVSNRKVKVGRKVGYDIGDCSKRAKPS